MTDPAQQVLLVVIGLLVGAYGSIIGAGGGFLLVPVLLLLNPGESTRSVTTLALSVACISAVSGTLAYARLRRIDFLSGLLLAAFSLPGSIAGAWIVRLIERRVFDVAFACFLIALCVFLLARGSQLTRDASAQPGWIVRTLLPLASARLTWAYSPRVAALISFVSGFVSSSFGIGGGPILVPALAAFLHFPIHIATATSMFVIMLSTFVGTVTHAVAGDFDFGLQRIILLAIGVIAGSQLGAALSSRIPTRTIIRLLAAGVGVIAFQLLRTSLFSA